MRIAALSTLLLLAGAPTARAGMVLYTWAPMVGGGTYQDRSGQSITYTSSDGSLTVGWDPDNPAHDYAVGAVGAPINESFGAGGGGAAGSLTITFSGGDGMTLFGTSLLGQISVQLIGDPGPLAPSGLPQGLGGFLQNPANVLGGAGGYSQPVNFTFRGVAAEGAPEPSTLLMLAIGIGGVALSRAGRRTAARPWWPWASG